MNQEHASRSNLLPAAAAVLIGAVYLTAFLGGESQGLVMGLLAGGAAILLALGRSRLALPLTRSIRQHGGAFGGLLVLAVAGMSLYFADDSFVLFLIATVILNVVICLGLNIQFGYAGVVNFSGASFVGIGAYTAAILTRHTATPHLLVLLAGGIVAVLATMLLIVPVLKTRGHYAAMVTIAFALLFKTFLEVNNTLGGPQGLKCSSLRILGWDFNRNLHLGSWEGSFYLGYIAVILGIAVLGFIAARRLDNSWMGLSMDAMRFDETASACFGMSIPRWKITAFTIGNFYCGVAGAFMAMMLGYIAPTNFTFGDSLILVSIVLLGGLGSTWGVLAATVLVIILPEKFQTLQEYRFLLYSSLVILILLFRPQGLLPRQMRHYFPQLGRSAQ